MKKVSYRSQKVGESENATNILSKLKAHLSLQSLLLFKHFLGNSVIRYIYSFLTGGPQFASDVD